MLNSKQNRPRLRLALPPTPPPDHAFPLPPPASLPFPLPPPASLPFPIPQPAGAPPSLPLPLPSKLPADSEDVDPDDCNRLQLLGYGSSGKVYRVQHNRTGRIYALKIIQEIPGRQDMTVQNQIIKEMEILQRANHPNIVRCYGSCYKAGEISFVLEYMGGGSLADVLGVKKVLSECCIAEVARQVLKGLSYLHREKIVHRDIKPSNLLINKKQEVKIADFGVSTILASSLDPCSSFVGTCAYMCPERFDPDSNGGNYNGYAADIWSLGLSLLECATGHFPFLAPGQRADWPTLMFAICYGDPPSPPANASADFKNFIKHCLQKDASRRLPASTLLSHPFVTKYEGAPSGISALLQSLKL